MYQLSPGNRRRSEVKEPGEVWVPSKLVSHVGSKGWELLKVGVFSRTETGAPNTVDNQADWAVAAIGLHNTLNSIGYELFNVCFKVDHKFASEVGS